MSNEERDQLAAVLYTAVAERVINRARRKAGSFTEIPAGIVVTELASAARLSLAAADLFCSELEKDTANRSDQ